KTQILLPVITGQDSTVIPVTVFHGQKKGPVLGITAGVHGLEYAPIMAAQALSKELNPTQMSGTVILVHLANVPSFLNRTLMVNPQDGKNLNRVFPGKAQGTSTERMAWIISNQIIARCNYFIDVHAGDANNDLRPYAGYYNYFNLPEVSEKARQMATALGYDFIVQFGNQASLNEESIYCSREAIKRNIPAVDIECGRMGIVEEKPVLQIQQALKSLLRHLKILEGKPDGVQNPVIIAKRTSLESEHTGFFYSDITSGDYVKKGMKLGYITNLFGEKITEVTCPVDGVVLYKTFNPPVKKGDGLFSIGHIQ
ncbi:MAG: M14 family metallopeptidase, partial [Bacteroidota bacterium]|nr:M14 family metallopeptidase [Bacteroidota bacterium]